jgi:hypothetical protein
VNIEKMVLERNEEIAWSELGDEIVVLDIEEGTYYTLNQVSAEIWKLADGKRTIAEIVDLIFAGYEADREQIRDDVTRIIGDFSEKNLIELSLKIEEEKKGK